MAESFSMFNMLAMMFCDRVREVFDTSRKRKSEGRSRNRLSSFRNHWRIDIMIARIRGKGWHVVQVPGMFARASGLELMAQESLRRLC